MSTSANQQSWSTNLTVTQVLLARIAALEAENQLLQHQVNTDELTGLYNRRGFHRTIAQEWRRCTRRKEPLSLILTGIDHFKCYNESKGRAGGDMLLRHLTQNFMDISKRAGDSLARYGGDEFACILPDTGLEGAKGLAEKMRIHANLLSISISVGVASQIPQQDEDPSMLIEAVEAALIRAKQQGRNRVAVAASSCRSA